MSPVDDDKVEEYDVVVLGGGPVGENFAQYSTEGSELRAVLIDGELFGGECSYYACIPSKALLRPIEVADTAAHLGGLSAPRLDVDGLLDRRDTWVSNYDDSGQVQWAAEHGIDTLRGHGRIVAERLVEVDSADGPRRLRARHVVAIATGSEPTVPAMYAECLPWGSRDATGIQEVPERLLIVGGGVVACEAATWMRGLGAEVTMLVRDKRLLARTEPFAGEVVRAALVAAGVDVRLGASVGAVQRTDGRDTGRGRIHGGPVRATVGGEELIGDEILVATGRRPRLGEIGLDSIGLSADDVLHGRVPEWMVLVGDASGEAPLTHWGKYRARVFGERLVARVSGRPQPPVPATVPVPQVVFTIPQVASVGLTEDEARSSGVRASVAQVPWSAAAGGGLLRDDTEGAAQLVVDGDTGRLLGATFVGPGAGELIHAATIAIVGGVPVSLLRHAVPSYPTASELWLRLLEALPVELRQR